jgi:hypothetical protein
MKVVINKCYGGFSISHKAAEYMAERGSERAKLELAKFDGYWFGFGYNDEMIGGYERSDPLLVEVVETLGTEANSRLAELKVVEIPDGVEWEIENYDGIEHVAEKHRTWD